jgi:hypothetical protein
MSGPQLSALLPYLVIAAIMLMRWRNISRPRPVRPAMLVVVPLVVLVVASLWFFELPAVPWGWAAAGTGLALGGVAGWQRTRLMHLERGEDGRIMVRNSPAAFLFVIAVLALRKLFAWETGMDFGHKPSPAELVAIYGTLGFVVGLMALSRYELWRRARGLD